MGVEVRGRGDGCAPRARRSRDRTRARAARADQTWLNDAYTASLAAIPNGPSKEAGIEAGENAAAAMLLKRTGDGRYVPFSFTCGEDPGEWRPTAG